MWLAAGQRPKGHENDAWALGWTFHAAATGLNFFSYDEDRDVYAQAVAGEDLRGNIACALSKPPTPAAQWVLLETLSFKLSISSNRVCVSRYELYANNVHVAKSKCPVPSEASDLSFSTAQPIKAQTEQLVA